MPRKPYKGCKLLGAVLLAFIASYLIVGLIIVIVVSWYG